jgi:hypothetical protein
MKDACGREMSRQRGREREDPLRRLVRHRVPADHSRASAVMSKALNRTAARYERDIQMEQRLLLARERELDR